jgi:hypothetical protein
MFGIKTTSKNDDKYLNDKEILELSHKVVNRYVSRGSIPIREKEDVAMSVIEKFLKKQEDINKRFQGQSKYTTYCIAVLNRMCCEIIRKELKHWDIRESDIYEKHNQNQLSSSDMLMIKDETKNLNKIIIMFGAEKYKIRLFIAYYYRLRIILNDIKNYDSDYINHNLELFFNNSEGLSKAEVFENLANVVNLVENKEIKNDAVRMWLKKVRMLIIERLNNYSGKMNYDNDSFQALYEYYYVEGNYFPEIQFLSSSN